MSAFPDDPEHFLRWLRLQPSHPNVTGQCFVSRKIYGTYLSDLLGPWLNGPEPKRLRIVRETAASFSQQLILSILSHWHHLIFFSKDRVSAGCFQGCLSFTVI